MRIALATEVHAPKLDGISNRIAHTVRELCAQGHELLTIAPAPAEPVCETQQLVCVPGMRLPLYPEVQLGFPSLRIASALLRFSPHVLHAVGPVSVGTSALLAARALAIPTLASFHTDLPAYAARYGYPQLERPAWRALRAIHGLAELNLCPSRATRDALVARGFAAPGLWRGGVDPERFHPRKRSLAMRERLAGGRVDCPLLLYVGRLEAEKRLHTLAPVLAELHGARLALVGEGPERPRLEKCFAELPVTFLGSLTGDELAEAYASADAFVTPSVTETLGFTVLEAMASGLPVVAADAGGSRDLVEHEATGLLYDPRESKGALEPVRRLLGSRALAADLARQGRSRAEEASWGAETRRLVRSYERAIECAAQRSWRASLRVFWTA